MNEQRPFKCGNCGNYYTPLVMPDDVMCRWCQEGKHSPHPKTNTVDCHWGQASSTRSEMRMVQVLDAVKAAGGSIAATVDPIHKAPTQVAVTSLLTKAETAFVQAERLVASVPEIVRWAGVFEMPGRTDEAPEDRFRSVEAIQKMVKDNRRPPEDVADLERSIKICTALADEVPPLMAEARVAIGQARQAAQTWKAPKAAAGAAV